MIKLKIFAALIFIFGLLLFVLGIELLVSLERNIQLMEQMQRAGRAQDINLPIFRTIIINSAISYLVVGLLSLVSGVGLFLLKNWARLMWLGMLVLLAVMNLYWLVSEYRRDTLGVGNFLVYFVIGAVIIGMWLYFNNHKTKNLFQRSVVKSAV
jgi:hypothetical protein